MKFTHKPLLLAAVAAAVGLTPLMASAQNVSEVDRLRAALLMLSRTLVEKNVMSVNGAQDFLREAGMDPAALTAGAPPAASAVTAATAATAGAVAGAAALTASASASAPATVRVPYVSESVKREMREEIRQEVLAQARAERWGDPGALPSWLSKVTLAGDVRVRLQRDSYPSDNDSALNVDSFYQLASGATGNTTDDRDRMRVRARLGVQAKVADEVDAGLRLVTSSGGDANNPISANVDLGKSNRRLGTAFDLAYVAWNRGFWSARAGRTANPYLSSDLMWSADMTMDGASVTWAPVQSVDWSGFITAGVHPLQEINNSATSLASDKFLFAAQAGGRWQGLGGTQVRAGAALYDFHGIESDLNPATPAGNTLNNDGAPTVRQRGNTMFNIAALSNPSGAAVWGVASKFRVLNLTAAAEFGYADPWRFGVNADYVHNLGFDAEDIRARIGAAADNLPTDASGQTGLSRPRLDGYRLEFSAGYGPRDLAGSWQAFAGYRVLQRDAVPDAFASADYRLGGTDQKAVFLGGSYNLAPNTSITARYVNADSLDLAPKYGVRTWTLDLNTRF